MGVAIVGSSVYMGEKEIYEFMADGDGAILEDSGKDFVSLLDCVFGVGGVEVCGCGRIRRLEGVEWERGRGCTV